MSEYYRLLDFLEGDSDSLFNRYLNERVAEDKANVFKLQASMTLRDLNVFLDVLEETLQQDPELVRQLEEDLAAGRLR